MIVLTPTEAATLRAVLERVAAEGDEDSATAVAVLDNGELLLGIGRSWELGGDVEFVDTIGGEVEACPDCARIRMTHAVCTPPRCADQGIGTYHRRER